MRTLRPSAAHYRGAAHPPHWAAGISAIAACEEGEIEDACEAKLNRAAPERFIVSSVLDSSLEYEPDRLGSTP
jgi:hypothetical protein